jgi:hypothetical protein
MKKEMEAKISLLENALMEQKSRYNDLKELENQRANEGGRQPFA